MSEGHDVEMSTGYGKINKQTEKQNSESIGELSVLPVYLYQFDVAGVGTEKWIIEYGFTKCGAQHFNCFSNGDDEHWLIT